MKIKYLPCFMIFSLLIISCSHTYKKYDKDALASLSWETGQELIFIPVIDDIAQSYTITFGLRHHYAFQLPSFDIKLKMISPSGKETSKTYTLIIRDTQNKLISKCAGDLCDLEMVVEENMIFSEAGQYKFVITQNARGRISSVMEFGLIIDQV